MFILISVVVLYHELFRKLLQEEKGKFPFLRLGLFHLLSVIFISINILRSGLLSAFPPQQREAFVCMNEDS